MARPIWTGSISFGLVSIPVEMRMAVHEKSVHFHMVTKDGGCRLRRKLVCPDTGKEYDFDQTAKGVEVAPNEYAIVDQREIDRLKPEKGKSLDIVQFVDLKAVDPVFLDRVYYLTPGKDAKKAYKLLTAAMSESNKCALGRFVMRERQYTAMIRSTDQGMVLHTLHYSDEVEAMDEELGESLAKIKLSPGEMKMAGELIKAMTRPLHMKEFKDEYREQLQALIDAKAHGKELQREPEAEDRPIGRTINLMEALKKSLAAGNGAPADHNGHHKRAATRHRRSA